MKSVDVRSKTDIVTLIFYELDKKENVEISFFERGNESSSKRYQMSKKVVSDAFSKIRTMMEKDLEHAILCIVNDSLFIIKENFTEEDKNLFARNIMEMDRWKFFERINGSSPSLFLCALISEGDMKYAH